jgi:uncharacterized protein (TIGR02453 family)
MSNTYFSKDSMLFLQKLAQNNNRDWFNENKQWYEDAVRTPALQFIEDMAGDIRLISPYFTARPQKMGGSLMRIHRDVRFGKDKRPYKTNVGIQFRHERGKDVHAPGFYLHIEPGGCFLGAGIWRPDASALGKIRDRIVEKGDDWVKASRNKTFKKYFELSGESLQRPPRGYDKDEPQIEDLKRKDFIAIMPLEDEKVLSNKFIKTVADQFNVADDYMHFLCDSLELQY